MSSRKTDLKIAFNDWRIELMEHLKSLGHNIGPKFNGGPLVDARIPYDWGWTPYRTALGILNMSGGDSRDLGDAMSGDEPGMLKGRLAHRKKEREAKEAGQ